MKTFFKKIVTIAICITAAASLIASNTVISEAKAKKASSTTSKNIIVVLDPGHDTTHLGCHYENFEEGIANLYIAYYCKQELERYKGVTVHLTRYGFECPYGANPDSSADCLTARVNFAKSVNADVLVSLHNDYDPDLDKTQNGAKVIVPNPNYLPELCVKGSDLGKSILGQLTTTGLAVNDWKLCPNGTGIVTRDSDSGKYPDGSAKDYYALINKAKTSGFTAVIVEHAFCTNNSDRLNHLSTPEQYQQLGIADATGIAQYYRLTLK